MHPHLAAVQPNSQVTLDVTINPLQQLTKGNSIVGHIEIEHDDNKIEDGKKEEWGDLNEFSSSEFPLNERCSFYMGCVTISSESRHAIEFVYMIEAESIVHSQIL